MRTTILGAATAALLSTTALVSAQSNQEPRTNQPAMKEQGATPDATILRPRRQERSRS